MISEIWEIFQKIAKLVHFTLETKKVGFGSHFWGTKLSSLIHNKTSQFEDLNVKDFQNSNDNWDWMCALGYVALKVLLICKSFKENL